MVDELIAETFPDAVIDYELPNATVGYQPGYGVVGDFRQKSELIRCGSSSSRR